MGVCSEPEGGEVDGSGPERDEGFGEEEEAEGDEGEFGDCGGKGKVLAGGSGLGVQGSGIVVRLLRPLSLTQHLHRIRRLGHVHPHREGDESHGEEQRWTDEEPRPRAAVGDAVEQ